MNPSATSSTSRVGLLGLGLMGQAMASRLLAAGFCVTGWDLRVEACEALTRLGGGRAATPEQLFQTQDRLLLSLPDSQIVRQVLEKNRSWLRPGMILVDTSTGSPEDASHLSLSLEALGVSYLDATVSGSSVQTARGEAVCMVGGDAAIYAECADLWTAIGSRAFHTGASGSGAKMKLVTNLVLGLNRAALAEGLAFARAMDLPLDSTLEVMRTSMAYSRIMDTKGEKMIRSDFAPPQARLSQHLKDVRLMLDATELPLPLTEAHRELLEQAERLGLGDLDNSALFRVYPSTQVAS